MDFKISGNAEIEKCMSCDKNKDLSCLLGTSVSLDDVPKRHHCHTQFIDHTCNQGFSSSCYTALLLCLTVLESSNFYQDAQI